MTRVRFDIVDSLGLDVDSDVYFSINGTRVINDTSGDAVRLPIARTYRLTSEPLILELPSTTLYGGGWAYEISWRIDGYPHNVMYFLVPQSSEVLGFEDLTAVDPSSLSPISVVAAWVAELDALRDYVDEQLASVSASPSDPESIRDIVASFIVPGSNVTVTHNDASNTLTIAAAVSQGPAGPAGEDGDPGISVFATVEEAEVAAANLPSGRLIVVASGYSSVLATINGPGTPVEGDVTTYSVTLASGTIGSIQWSIDGISAGTTSTITPTLATGNHTISVTGTSSTGASFSAMKSVIVTAQAGGTINHGFEITSSNTGFAAYYDSGLGRNLLLTDLTVVTTEAFWPDYVDNGVIERYWFQAGLTPYPGVSDITIRQCRIDGTMQNYTQGNEIPYSAQWVTVNTTGTAGNVAAGFSENELYRCSLQGSSDVAWISGGSMIECFGRTKSQNSGDHNDGMQNSGGLATIVRRCNIDSRPLNGGGGPNAALFTADGATGVQEWTDNYLAGGAYTIRCYGDPLYPTQTSGLSFQVNGNWVAQGGYGAGPAARAAVPQSQITEWADNFVVDSSGNQITEIAKP